MKTLMFMGIFDVDNLWLDSSKLQLFWNQKTTIMKPKRNQFIGRTFTSHKAVDPI